MNMEQYLRIGSGAVNVTWEDEDLDDLVRSMFSPWRGEECASAHRIVIHGRCDIYIMETDESAQTCAGKEMLAVRLEQTLTLLAQKLLNDYLQVHASCIDLDGRGVLIVGAHGAGKTTLALTAISSGFRALGDDIAVVDRDLCRVRGFPRPFKVTNGTRALEPTVIPGDCPQCAVTPETTYVFFTKPPGRYYSSVTRLHRIIFPLRREGPTTIHTLGEREAMHRLFAQGFNYKLHLNDIVESLLFLLRNAPPLEITYSDHWEAVNMIAGLLACNSTPNIALLPTAKTEFL